MPRPGGVRRRPAELAADGLLCPAQIIRDARDHGVLVRPLDVLDVNRSAWDCMLEPEPSSQEGLARQEAEQIVKARQAGNGSPFASVEEVVRRASLSRKATEALAAAGGPAAELLLDSTHVKAHRCATGGKGGRRPWARHQPRRPHPQDPRPDDTCVDHPLPNDRRCPHGQRVRRGRADVHLRHLPDRISWPYAGRTTSQRRSRW